MLQRLNNTLRIKRERIHRLREIRPVTQPLIREAEILSQLQDHGGGILFLNALPQGRVHKWLSRSGIFSVCTQAGFANPEFAIDTSDAYRHVLRIYAGKRDRTLLVEVVLRTACFHWKQLYAAHREVTLLVVEWTLLQNPHASFDAARLPLPGQRYPGLGVGERIIEFLLALARELNVDGIVVHPQYYHLAVIYSKGFRFLHPETEAVLQSLRRDLASIDFTEAAWAVHRGLVREGRKKFRWIPEEQVLPIASHLIEYFSSDAYKQPVEAAMQKLSYSVRTRRRRRLQSLIRRRNS